MMSTTRLTLLAARTLALALVWSLAAEPARADDSAAGASVVTDAPGAEARPWSLATGIGFPFALGGVGGWGAPGASILVGRHLLGPLSILARVAGSHSQAQLQDGNGPSSTTTNTTGMVSLGLRVSFTSPEILEVSAFALASTFFSQGGVDDAVSVETGGIGGELGLSLDREIVPGFGIRVSTTVLGASYRELSASTLAPGSETTTRNRGLVFFLGLAPTVELRWSL